AFDLADPLSREMAPARASVNSLPLPSRSLPSTSSWRAPLPLTSSSASLAPSPGADRRSVLLPLSAGVGLGGLLASPLEPSPLEPSPLEPSPLPSSKAGFRPIWFLRSSPPTPPALSWRSLGSITLPLRAAVRSPARLARDRNNSAKQVST